MFTKLSDWRKRELGNRVPNALRPENLSHFQASFRLYLRINACGLHGALVLAIAVLLLGIGLLRSPHSA